MGFLALLINFFVTFSFTLGFMQISASVLALFFFRKEIPSLKIMFLHNIVSAILISFSYTLIFSYLPTIYSQAKLNNGVLRLYSKTMYWSRDINISATDELVRFNLCSKEIVVKNNMSSFYDKLNSSLEGCGLPKNSEIYVDIVKSPFHHIEDMSSNSIIRKYVR